MKISVEFYASLREESGKQKESFLTQSVTLKDLYQELQQKYQFKLPQKSLKVAVNSEFVSWSTKLKTNDVVIFIPPVAGG